MAKSASPVRLQDDLMQAATAAGKMHHRSAAEQIEYWAALGRAVANTVTPDTILSITAGLVRLVPESVDIPTVDPDDLFTSIEQARHTGDLVERVVGDGIRYQAANDHPGLLERIEANGDRTLGTFANGEFIPYQG